MQCGSPVVCVCVRLLWIADVWSLGSLIFEIATGRPPYLHGTPWNQIVNFMPTVYAPCLLPILKGCMQTDVTKRFTSLQVRQRVWRTPQSLAAWLLLARYSSVAAALHSPFLYLFLFCSHAVPVLASRPFPRPLPPPTLLSITLTYNGNATAPYPSPPPPSRRNNSAASPSSAICRVT
jgi:serine/threonine protein kinase